MAELNLNDLNSSVDEATRNLNSFGSGLNRATSATGLYTSATQQARSVLEQEEADAKARKEAIKKGINEVVKRTLNLTTSLTSGQSNFNVLNGVIDMSIKSVSSFASSILRVAKLDGIADAIDTAGKAGAEIAKEVINQFQVGWNAYKQVTDSGIVGSFGELRNLAKDSNLRFEQLAGSLGKYSKTLASLNSESVLGAGRFGQLATASKSLRENMYVLGINSQEFAEYQAKYLDEQLRLGQMRGKTNAELVQGTQKYIEELDAQAKLFGLSRREAQSARDIALSQNNFRAALNVLSKEIADPQRAALIKDRATKLSVSIEKQAPEVAAGFRDLFAANGSATTQMAQDLLAATGGEAADIAKRVRSGEIDEIEARNRLVETLKRNNQQYASIIQFGDNSSLGKLFAKAQDFIESGVRTSEDVKTARTNKAAGDGFTKNLAETAVNLDTASVELQQAATASTGVTKAMRMLTSWVREFVDKLEDFAKKDNKPSAPPTPTPSTQQAAQNRQSAETKVQAAATAREQAERDTGRDSDASRKARIAEQNARREAERARADEETARRRESQRQGVTGLGRQQQEPKKPGEPGTAPATSADGKQSNAASLQKIRDFIAQFESRGDYNILFGNKTVPGGLTTKTLADVLAIQAAYVRDGSPSSAAGKYQFLQSTLRETAQKLGLPFGSTLFNETTQDQLADSLIRSVGYDDYVNGKITKEQFADNLAKKWAALPLSDGRSYYQGDSAGNKALVDRQTFLASLTARTGGIFRGPSTGYLTELSGDKAVIPANDGVSKQALNTASVAGGGNDVELLRELYALFEDKFDSMVDLLTDSEDSNTKLLRSMT